MNLEVIGIGLVSPGGASASDHVFFLRAGAPPPRPSPYLLADDRPVDVAYCPWIENLRDASGRMCSLASQALEEAFAPLSPERKARRTLMLCTAAPQPDEEPAALDALAVTLQNLAGAEQAVRMTGAASAFAGLEQLATAIDEDVVDVGVLLAVDTLVTPEAVRRLLDRPPSPWRYSPRLPAEGAGALVLTSPSKLPELGATSLGTVLASSHGMGQAHDDNDEAIDAQTMTELVRELPSEVGPIASVFGQSGVDELRTQEWEWSVARNSARFEPVHHGGCLEAQVGRVGAAAGVMNLAYAFASLRHHATPAEALYPSPMVAWATSRDGRRGIALGRGGLP